MDHPVVVRASLSCRHAMSIIHLSGLVGAEIKVGPLSITIHRLNLFEKQRRIAHDVIGHTVSPRDGMPACSAGLASIIPVKHVFAHAYAQQPCRWLTEPCLHSIELPFFYRTASVYGVRMSVLPGRRPPHHPNFTNSRRHPDFIYI
ncbi:hypothetical protein CPAR01_07227 [Colletotrichum paranaense]|uniref:Uncharacterized protein n=1 Tax=Colletotrichum paranaense TaxID=1914294 RepID=A0ABQ9SP67_9PEZI|nr:uncharacterized protein CPAR01_07227 [Colletotrichum paranaense]KAK1541238.1 hypothetical protein CPAR01_07227 [Colletotrichum paranaense]